MSKVARVDIMILGERNYPEAQVKLPDVVVADLPVLVEAAQAVNPSASYADVVRAIWRYGSREVRSALARGGKLSPQGLPGMVKPVSKEPRGK